MSYLQRTYAFPAVSKSKHLNILFLFAPPVSKLSVDLCLSNDLHFKCWVEEDFVAGNILTSCNISNIGHVLSKLTNIFICTLKVTLVWLVIFPITQISKFCKTQSNSKYMFP